MKNIVGCSLIALAVIGCSKSEMTENPPSQDTGSVNTPGSPTPTPNTPTGDAGKPTPLQNAPGNPKMSPSADPKSMPTNVNGGSRVSSGMPPRVPTENLAAKPPQSGEKVADNFKIEVGERSVEVEGVCKLTEDEAICWKPNGEKSDALATELTNAMKNQRDSYSGNYQVKFLKKNRILVLKTTIQPVKPGSPGFSGSYGIAQTGSYGRDFQEGWNTNSNIFNTNNSQGFDNTRIERQVMSGAFEKGTKTFPLRYQFTAMSSDRQVIDLKKGSFTVDGNTYNITSIGDQPPAGGGPSYYPGPDGRPGKPPKATYLTIEPVTIKNPYSVISMSPADANGSAYVGKNDKGEPLNAQDFQKVQQEQQRKMMEESKNGRPYINNWNNQYIGGIGLDPQQSGRSNHIGQFNIELSKVKKLVLSVNRRTVYVFDKIKLDQNN